MSTVTLVTTHKKWSKAETARYARQTVELTGVTDYLGQQEGIVLSGEGTGIRRWFARDEVIECVDQINRESPNKMVDVIAGEVYDEAH